MPIEIAPGETLQCEIHVLGRPPGSYATNYQVYVESKGVLFIEDVPLSLTFLEGEMPADLKQKMDEMRQATQEELPASPDTDSESAGKGEDESSTELTPGSSAKS